MKYINSNLITLKLVLFLFFGGIGCLFPFVPLHMTTKGLSVEESKTVSIYSSLIAIVGPIAAGILADRFAGSFGGPYRNKTGTYLRIFTAISVILAAIFYSILAAIPPIVKSPPSVIYGCDEFGSFILQQRCGSEKTCYNWDGVTEGSVLLTNCRFSCNATTHWTGEAYRSNEITTIYPEADRFLSEEDEEDYEEGGLDSLVEQELPEKENYYRKIEPAVVPLPHLCYQSDPRLCEVYSANRRSINLKLALNPHDESNSRNVNNDDICTYTTATPIICQIPQGIVKNLTKSHTNDCQPVIKCDIQDAYNSTDSLLKVSQCGYNNISFYLYLLLKSLGDIFIAAAVTLLGTAVVIATRETSTGRGDVGKQFAAGSLGLALFAPIIGGPAQGHFLVALISFAILFAFAALILIFDFKMPLSPPEWWWHTKCGLLALPMSSVRKYGLETCALGLVLFLLGIFWNALDSYLPWHIAHLKGSSLIIGLSVTVGALPAIPYLIFAEKIVDYCGHSNLLIICFVNYIIHYTALTFIEQPGILLVVEALEIFTLHLMWVTAVLYLRHLVPRKFTACGQALPVIAHFCLGRFIGSLLGGIGYTGKKGDFVNVHYWFAISAAIVGAIYFLLYHFYLKPRCAAPIQRPPAPSPAIVQSVNGSGTYTPLRIYHNGMAKKGQFRY